MCREGESEGSEAGGSMSKDKSVVLFCLLIFKCLWFWTLLTVLEYQELRALWMLELLIIVCFQTISKKYFLIFLPNAQLTKENKLFEWVGKWWYYSIVFSY